MMPAMLILASWLIFTSAHLGLSASGARQRFSPQGFVVLFSLISALSMLPLIGATITYAADGLEGPRLGEITVLRWALGGFSLFGASLVVAGLLNYPRSPMAKLAERTGTKDSTAQAPLSPPGPVDRITRHPFFVGLGMLAAAHVLLASTLASAAFFVGLAAICFVGIPLQDRKLRNRWREEYSAYEESTSIVPTLSNTAEQQNKSGAAGELRWLLYAAIGGFAVLLSHSFWSWGNGAAFLMIILLFGSLSVVAALFRRA